MVFPIRILVLSQPFGFIGVSTGKLRICKVCTSTRVGDSVNVISVILFVTFFFISKIVDGEVDCILLLMFLRAMLV